jgi:hypothetical protein
VFQNELKSSLLSLMALSFALCANCAWAAPASYVATASSQQAGFEASKLITGGTWKSGTSNLRETLTIILPKSVEMPLFQFKLKQKYASYQFVGTTKTQNGILESMSGSGNSTYYTDNFATVTVSKAQTGKPFNPTVNEIKIFITKQKATDAVELNGLIIDIAQSAWQNPANKYDTNADGKVTPLDVLIVINDINRSGSRVLPISKPASAAFIDVNGDGSVGPVDALQIINYINTRG